ncbi:MAG: ABC transporter substrate-binding protein [Oligoflexales bacterium]|nr:ABC transporter substrate-binding protein [Oligoflexales bacterium]
MICFKKYGVILSIFSLLGVTQSRASGPEIYKVGILQMVDDLDFAVKGFKEGLKELGYEEGKDIIYEYRNAKAISAKILEYGSYFVESKKDLIFACSTPVTKLLMNITATRKKNIPIVFTPVSDPVAAGLAKSWDSSGNNLTGVASGVVTDSQLEIMKQINPSIKRVLVFSKKGDNSSEEGLKKIESKAKELSIDLVVERPVMSKDVIAAMERIDLGTIDAIHIPPDTMVGNQVDKIFKLSRKFKIPIIVHSMPLIHQGGFMYYVADYYQLGKQAARQANKILKEKIPPHKIPIEKPVEYFLGVNKDLLKEYKLKLPDNLAGKAKLVPM